MSSSYPRSQSYVASSFSPRSSCYFARGLCVPFLWLCACCWSTAVQGRHAQTNAGHSQMHEGPAQTPHALAGTQCPPAQADWQTQKQRRGTRRLVQSTRQQEGHVVQAPEPGEIRPSRMVHDGPNERSVGIRACNSRPCQRPGPLLELYLPSSHPSMPTGRVCKRKHKYFDGKFFSARSIDAPMRGPIREMAVPSAKGSSGTSLCAAAAAAAVPASYPPSPALHKVQVSFATKLLRRFKAPTVRLHRAVVDAYSA